MLPPPPETTWSETSAGPGEGSLCYIVGRLEIYLYRSLTPTDFGENINNENSSMFRTTGKSGLMIFVAYRGKSSHLD